MHYLEDQGYAPVEWQLCPSHIKDRYLGQQLTATEDGACTFCGSASGPMLAGDDLLDLFVIPFHQMYQPHHLQALYDDDVGLLSQYDTHDVVIDLGNGAFDADCGPELCTKISEAIDKATAGVAWTDYGGAIDETEFTYSWDQFVAHVKYQSRSVFIEPSRTNTPTMQFLRQIRDYAAGPGALLDTIEPGTPFYRARIVDRPYRVNATKDLTHGSDCLGPAGIYLGPPPPRLASANRMSPAGISIFYASATSETALREITAHRDGRYALVGRFRSTCPLQVLNLTSMPSTPSAFDPSQLSAYRAIKFLEVFRKLISEPIPADTVEHIDYAPTQLVASYFQHVSATNGIVFPSAHTGADNYALFYGPSISEVPTLPPLDTVAEIDQVKTWQIAPRPPELLH